LQLDEPDDVEDVVARKEAWIRLIMSSFAKPYSATPVVEDFEDLRPVFKQWQDEQYSLVMKVIGEDKIGNLVEAAATSVYSKIVRSHKLRALDNGGNSFHCDPTLKCSARLTECIGAMEQLTIIRHDVIRNMRVAELTSNPAWMMKRKQENKIDNDNKAIVGRRMKVLEKQLLELKREDDSSESKEEIEDSACDEVSMSGSDED